MKTVFVQSRDLNYRRIGAPVDLPPFQLERYFARHEFSAPHLLGCSDCEAMTIAELLALETGAAEAFGKCWLGYTEAAGSFDLRAQISRIYTTIAPEQVVVHTGAEEAIFLFMQAALHCGDHVIVQWPAYASLFEVARGLGCTVSFWEAREENAWAPDLADLEKLIRPETRAVVVNTPHNPTGHLLTREDQKTLISVVRKHNLTLFSDEVYRESEYDPALRLPAACDLDPRAVSLGVLSKTYGLPGLRIGWIATRNHAIYERMAALKDYTTICNSAPSEFLATVALHHRQHLAARNLQTIRANLTLLDDFFTRHAERLTWVRPKAGPIAFVRLIGQPVEPFCRRLIDKAGVLVLPGTLYDHPGNHFRIGFGRRTFPTALDALEIFLENDESTGPEARSL